jgi:DNA-binding MurR/RpiR family transcriptional regulator
VLGFTANWSADPATTIAQIHLLNPGDVVVGFSLHGASLTIVEALEQAHQRGVTTLGITSIADSAVSRAADVPIVVFGGEEAMAFGQFASRAAAATLLDALASAVAWEKREVSVPHAREVTRTNQRLHSAFNPRER